MKHKYNADELIYSDGFAPEKYIDADAVRARKRKQAKKQKANDYSKIIEYAKTNKITEFSFLVDGITSEKPELLGALFEKQQLFKNYVDSQRNRPQNGINGMSYPEMLRAYDRMDRDYKYISEQIKSAREVIEELKLENDRLRKYCCELANAPEGDPDVMSVFWHKIDVE